jgi:hypothetical protein
LIVNLDNQEIPDFFKFIGNDQFAGHALEAWKEGNDVLVLCLMDNMRCLQFVRQYFPLLRARGTYEKCLLHAYSGTRTNYAGLPTYELPFLFGLADRGKLLAAGDPLPDGEEFTLYRGVSGNGRARRVRGISWTSDPACAAWFAKRYTWLNDPAVFTVTVERDRVFAFINHRNENEFLVDLEPDAKVRRLRKLPDHQPFMDMIKKNWEAATSLT